MGSGSGVLVLEQVLINWSCSGHTLIHRLFKIVCFKRKPAGKLERISKDVCTKIVKFIIPARSGFSVWVRRYSIILVL